MEGEATGPRSGHYVARVTAHVDGPSVVRVVNATIGTSDGDLRLTQTAVADLGPAGACAPLEPGEVLTWTAEVPGQGADAGTAVLSGEPAALVDSLTSTQPDDSDVPTGTPTDIPSGTRPPHPHCRPHR